MRGIALDRGNNTRSLYLLKPAFLIFVALLPSFGNAVLAPSVIACLAIASIFLFARVVSPADESRLFAALCICSFLLRASLALLLHDSAGFFGTDAVGYDRRGWYLAQGWKSGEPASVDLSPAYSYFVGAIYFVFGHTPMSAKIVNGFLGTLTAVFIYHTARGIYGRYAAWVAFLLTAFFPCLVLWSALMLKDTLAVFLIVLAIWSTVRLHSQFRIRYIITLLASMAYYTWIRWFTVPYILAAILSSFLVQPARGLIRNILAAAMVLVLLAAFWQYVPEKTKERYNSYSVDLEAINQVRGRFAMGGSEFLSHVTINSYTEALRFLPVGLLYFFLGPMPWQSHGLRQIITMPEMLIWYCLIPFMVYGFLYVLKNAAAKSYVIIVYVVSLTLAYSLGITNFGALYRYRSQLLVFYFVFVAVGIARWKGMVPSMGNARTD